MAAFTARILKEASARRLQLRPLPVVSAMMQQRAAEELLSKGLSALFAAQLNREACPGLAGRAQHKFATHAPGQIA